MKKEIAHFCPLLDRATHAQRKFPKLEIYRHEKTQSANGLKISEKWTKYISKMVTTFFANNAALIA